MRIRPWHLGALLLVATQAAGQRADSSMYTPTPEIRFGGTFSSTKRAVSAGSVPAFEAQTSLKGAEFLLRASGGSGLVVRYETGTMPGSVSNLASGKLEVIDGRVLLGERSFAVVAGYVLRSSVIDRRDKRMGLARLGINVGRFFEGAGFEVSFTGSYVRTPKEGKADSLNADGIEAQTALTYIPPRVPAYVQLGYSRETFNLKKQTAVLRREELSKLILTVGVQYGLLVR